MATLVLNPETTDAQSVLLDNPSILIGSAPDADVQLEDGAEQVARIEHKADGYYLITLDSTGGVLVNGSEVSLQRLKHGDKVEFDGVKAALLLADDEVEHEESAHEPMPLAFAGSNELATVPRGPSNCPQCGLPLSSGMTSCPQCGYNLSNLPAMPMGYIPPVPPGQVGPGILPIIAFLTALTVVGAPIALVLGLMTLSNIRRRGGTVRDRALAKWSIGLSLVWIMLGAVVAGRAVQQARKRKLLSAAEVHETKVIRALKNLACAQRYARTIEAFDVDSDGRGEYGDLEDLPSMESPFFDPDLADGEAYGYRFTIREASEGRFVAVAEPIHYEATGIRTFSIDQTGQIRSGDNEGEHFGQIESGLPVLQGERNAYYEIDDQIAKDVLNHVKSLSTALADQEKKQRILRRLRKNYSLTSIGLGLEGMKKSVDRFVSEERAQAMYREANAALTGGNLDVALSKMTEIQEEHPAFSQIASVKRMLSELRSMIAQKREQEAQDLFAKAEKLERQGGQAEEVQRLYRQIASRYPQTDVASRVSSLTPELQRQMRERNAEDLFSELMELSPESDYEEILSRIDQLRRNYNDTDLFAKIEIPLAEKERKAHANSWRVKTEENMAAGRMRGALAQLESAAEENTDLFYDLRDLFITLYRSVADTLVEEGDARKALTYYERLDQLLRAKGTEETTSPDLLARLHNKVGQADFERKKYATAKRHLAGAAWKYQEDASFNTRLGAANLHMGLYRPAKAALDQALAVQPKMSLALLYRSYLQLRSALAMEQVLVNSFQQTDDKPATSKHNQPATSKDAPPEESTSPVLFDMEDYDGDIDEFEEALRNSQPAEKVELNQPQNLKLKSTGKDWFSNVTSSLEDQDTAIPGPKDLDLFLGFNYQTSSSILPNFIQFIEELHQQKMENITARKIASEQGAGGRGDSYARDRAQAQMATARQKAMTKFRNLLRDLSKIHFEDVGSRDEFYKMISKMKQNLRSAADDAQAAAQQQPPIQSLTERVLSQINAKYKLLEEAETRMSFSMKKEINVRERIIRLAEDILEKDKITSTEESSMERTFSRIKEKLFDEESLTNIDRALRALRDSMDTHIDLESLIHAAEGTPQAAIEE